MLVIFRKISFTLILNTTLLLILMVGIQNSSYRKKVNLLIGESVSLPLSFVVGISFISGSLMGSLITNNLSSQKNSF
tara:strand:+ start:1135 stop:1365 length:231 start_codon:yes stop_codon:yes gene_type:complete